MHKQFLSNIKNEMGGFRTLLNFKVEVFAKKKNIKAKQFLSLILISLIFANSSKLEVYLAGSAKSVSH